DGDQDAVTLGVVADVGGRLHVLDDSLPLTTRLAAIDGRAFPARDEDVATVERHDAVELTLRQLLALALLALRVDGVDLAAAEGDDPDRAVVTGDDAVRTAELLVLDDLADLVVLADV